ncbi:MULTISPECIES: TIGR03915 family putative DNA repair protein [Desulfosediminicola]|uniref:TIGR03915 family putative DNA repair protein n=1 Tax=Desulfosediminicola TaxID=2886823 RepID=UPI0010AC8419|nr:TIGR03915 family putative DNA repair protein [Desulfosediminicola ganghwensis]
MNTAPDTFLYDGSFDGLLTAVAYAVKSQAPVAGVYAEHHYMPTLVAGIRQIKTEREQAQRLFSYLNSLGRMPARLAFNGYLSEDKESANYIHGLVRECLRLGKSAADYFASEPIRNLKGLDKKVSFEAHRLNGLIRFRILKDGLQYAPIEPDHNVISYCANHFIKRLANRRWILHDIARDLALFWDCNTLQPVSVADDFTSFVAENGEVPPEEMAEQELHYQQLWNSFHAAISNPARENHKLQRQLMPKRYWKYLVEVG